jgi:hypothetical protein
MAGDGFVTVSLRRSTVRGVWILVAILILSAKPEKIKVAIENNARKYATDVVISNERENIPNRG